MIKIKNNFNAYSGRAGRYDFMLDTYQDVFQGSETILDVGCSDNYLKQKTNKKVLGIDIAGTPDRIVDLEKESLSSFEDASYDLVICTEVLEHVDNLHQVFTDLCRVSSKYVIISLPNTTSWGRLSKILLKLKTGKFYGLPLSKPEDRHKWYFSHKEVVNFMINQKLVTTHAPQVITYHYSIIWGSEKKIFRRLFQHIKKNLISFFGIKNYAQEIFVLFEKI